MMFQRESDFENALIQILTTKGWEDQILKYPTEDDLLKNWAKSFLTITVGLTDWETVH